MANATPSSIEASEDVAADAVSKRYEGLVSLRAKAVKGKGAWYWAHFEPMLVRNSETNLPKAVKLKCTLCDAAFSASNPSRTATEHLKKGACPNFGYMLKPPQLPPLASPSSHRKRSLELQQSVGTSSNAYPISMVDPSRLGNDHEMRFLQGQGGPNPPVLSGGREDLKPLALLEDSVKKLKSTKASPVPTLSDDQVNKAFDLLADWFYESCGSVSFSSLENPKFRAFLNNLGLPAVSKGEFSCARLDSKFEEAKRESEARIRDASFFQVACDGWKSRSFANGDECLVKFTVNLPNGTALFQKMVCLNGGMVPSHYAEEVLWETVGGVCGNDVHRCVGVVADRYKAKALRNLELKNNWMINIPCQLQGFFSLIKDFHREFALVKDVTDKCLKVADLVNSQPQIRNCLHKFRLQGHDVIGFIRVPSSKCDISKNLRPFIAMLEDILACYRILHVVVLDDSYKVVCLEDHAATEVAEIIQDAGFLDEVEAVRSIVKMITGMAKEIESERPLVGQCLPLWDKLRTKVKTWATKYNFDEGAIEKIVQRRFEKNYHPALAAAFVLDPLNLVRDASGKYLPPFKCLTNEQEKDVDKLVTRLVSGEEAHIALMELMKWRSEGLDPLYAQAVQVKQRDPVTGKMKVANPQSSRLVWETCLKEFKSLGKVAVRLLFLHATSCGIKCDSSFTRWFCAQGHSKLGFERAHKLAFVAAYSRLERRDFSDAEEKDVELLQTMSDEDDMMNEALAHTLSI